MKIDSLRWLVLLALTSWATISPAVAEEPSDKKQPAKHRVAFVTNQQADFWNIAEKGCRAAEKDFDVEVDVRMPDTANATRQKQIVEDLIVNGIEALAISPIDATNQAAMMNDWCKKIPVITHDSDAPQSSRLVYIGMDNYAAGRMVGKLVRQAIPEGGKVCLFIGRLEQDNSKKRRQGVIDELLDRPNRADDDPYDDVEGEIANDKYTIVATMTDQGAMEVSKQKAEDALTAYPDLAVMVGLFEYNPPAILQALKQSNKLGAIKVVGFDENAATLQGIKDGNVVGTVVQNPYEYGYKSVEVLTKLLDGDKSVIPASKYIDIAPRSITKANVDEFWEDLKRLSSDN